MLRPIPSLIALLAAIAVAGPAIAADIGDNSGDDGSSGLRDGYPVEPGDWAGLGDKDDPLTFETGIRYWYSVGSDSFSSGGSSLSSTDAAHSGELHLRIEDHATNVYASALAGYSVKMDGSYSAPSTSGSFTDGHIGYIGADIGWNMVGDHNGSGFGPLVGYMYWQEAPDTGRFNYTTATTGSDVTYNPTTGQTDVQGDSSPNEIDTNLLRLGVQGKAKLGDFIDISGEVAAVPYAKVSGTVGEDDTTFDTSVYSGPAQPPYGGENGNISSMRSSPTTVDGWGYGAQAEAWLGIHPTDNLAVRLGGRLWYLQGSADETYSKATISNPGGTPGNYNTDPTVTNTNLINTSNPFSMLRYGLLAELDYTF
ncbi:MAG TPA: hypothetical protein VHZ56_14450 [Devosia sp.]|jgi:hypothetical protein|nr:hypothetical protein [Devosia sp.]